MVDSPFHSNRVRSNFSSDDDDDDGRDDGGADDDHQHCRRYHGDTGSNQKEHLRNQKLRSVRSCCY